MPLNPLVDIAGMLVFNALVLGGIWLYANHMNRDHPGPQNDETPRP